MLQTASRGPFLHYFADDGNPGNPGNLGHPGNPGNPGNLGILGILGNLDDDHDGDAVARKLNNHQIP